MIKYIFAKSKLSDYKDTYLNLAINMYSQSEPKPCHFEEINNMKISVWDHYKNINQDVYVKDLINELNKFYNVNIDTLIYGTKMILSSINTSKFNLKWITLALKEMVKISLLYLGIILGIQQEI